MKLDPESDQAKPIIKALHLAIDKVAADLTEYATGLDESQIRLEAFLDGIEFVAGKIYSKQDQDQEP